MFIYIDLYLINNTFKEVLKAINQAVKIEDDSEKFNFCTIIIQNKVDFQNNKFHKCAENEVEFLFNNVNFGIVWSW